MAKPALGRGLGALLGGNPIATPPATGPASPAIKAGDPSAPAGQNVLRVPLKQIHPCPFQPRKDFSAETLKELADSIREQGIVQPLIVRERNGHYELIAGERRWRAAQLAGLSEAPVIVRTADDRAVLELALIENLQRENLNPIEEAHGYAELMQQFGLSQEEVAIKVGKSRAVVANAIRLLKLVPPVREYVREGKLSVGHGKVLLGLTDEKLQYQAAEQILKEDLNVRKTEVLLARLQSAEGRTGTSRSASRSNDPHVLSIENRLRERLGTKISLRYSEGKGALEILFFSDADLERVLQIMGVQPD